MMEYSAPLDQSSKLYWDLVMNECGQASRDLAGIETPAIEDWLRDEIGYQCEHWAVSLPDSIIYFKHEEDKVKFILRWL